MNGFHTVFEASWSDLPWVMTLIGPAILVLAYVVARHSPKQHAKAVAGLALIIGTFWTIFMGMLFFQSAKVVNDFRSGQAQTLEGVITNFTPMPTQGHATESFTLNGEQFAYSNLEFHGPCFDRTVTVGGPMKNGLHVKLSRVGKCIVKLEIADASK